MYRHVRAYTGYIVSDAYIVRIYMCVSLYSWGACVKSSIRNKLVLNLSQYDMLRTSCGTHLLPQNLALTVTVPCTPREL